MLCGSAIRGLRQYREPREVLCALPNLLGRIQAQIDIAHAQDRGSQAHQAVIERVDVNRFFVHRHRATTTGRTVIGGGNIDCKCAVIVIGRAVADLVAKSCGMVFAAVMDKTDQVAVDVGLCKLPIGNDSVPRTVDIPLDSPVRRRAGQCVNRFVRWHGDRNVIRRI